MCPRNSLVRPKKHLESNLAKKVIQECAEHGISGLWLYYIGESLLHPDFFEILEYCRKYDSLGPIWLSTNGELLDEKIREKVLDQPVDILNYSVNAMSEENYKKVTPLLNFNRVQQNLKELVRRKSKLKKTKPVIRAQMIEIPYVLNEIEEFKKEFGSKVDMISVIKLELFSQGSGNTGNETPNKYINKCNRLEREDFFIFSDGSVTCCDTDYNCTFNLGNINKQTIKEIYEGEKYQSLIAEYRGGRLHQHQLCSRCHDFDL
jgi:radical SAM protein with 4Fe4S-binding SPASM domain